MMVDPILIDTTTPPKGPKIAVPEEGDGEMFETTDALFALALAGNATEGLPKIQVALEIVAPLDDHIDAPTDQTATEAQPKPDAPHTIDPAPQLILDAPQTDKQRLSGPALPAIAADAQQPAVPNSSPHAHGSKGPDPRSPQAEDPIMQLSRPNRLRTFPAAVTRSALTESAPPTPQDVRTNTVDPVTPVFLASSDTSDPRKNPHQRNEQPPSALPRQSDLRRSIPPEIQISTPRDAPTTAVSNWQTKPSKPISHNVISTDARPSIATTTSTPLAPTPIPQVVAAYTTIAATTPSKPDGLKSLVDEALPELPIARATETSVTTDPSRPASRPMPQASPEHVAAQLSQIAQNSALHRRDILLHPEELGRIRLNLSAQDNAVHVGIMVERPETLDLMRRYISQLTSEFQDLGYEDISFDFAQSDNDDTGEERTASEGASESVKEETGATPAPAPRQATPITGRLDLRI